MSGSKPFPQDDVLGLENHSQMQNFENEQGFELPKGNNNHFVGLFGKLRQGICGERARELCWMRNTFMRIVDLDQN